MRDAKKFHFFDFRNSFYKKISVSFTMVIKISPGGESAYGGRYTSKSTFAWLSFSKEQWEEEQEEENMSLCRRKHVWFGASTLRVRKYLFFLSVCQCSSPLWSRFRAWLKGQNLSSCNASVRGQAFCCTFCGLTPALPKKLNQEEQKSSNACPQVLIARVGYKTICFFDHDAHGRASIALWRPVKDATVNCCQWLAREKKPLLA